MTKILLGSLVAAVLGFAGFAQADEVSCQTEHFQFEHDFGQASVSITKLQDGSLTAKIWSENRGSGKAPVTLDAVAEVASPQNEYIAPLVENLLSAYQADAAKTMVVAYGMYSPFNKTRYAGAVIRLYDRATGNYVGGLMVWGFVMGSCKP
jgi:hypothetical protein